MKKTIRFLLKLSATLFLLLCTAIVLLFLFPSAQTAIARQWIPSDPGITPQLDYLKISLNGVEARGLATTISNVKVDLFSARAQLSLWQLLFSRTAHITTAEIHGARIDLTGQADPAPLPTVPGKDAPKEPDTPRPSPFTWPSSLIIDSLEMDAEVVLDHQQTATIQVTGKDLKTSGDSHIQYRATYQNTHQELPITSGDIQGTLQSHIDRNGVPQETRANAQIALSGNDFPKPIRFDLSLLTPQLASKILQLHLSSPDLPAHTPLPLQLDMRYREDQDAIEGAFQIAINSADWAAHLPPQLHSLIARIQGQGNFVYSPQSQTGNIQSTGSIHSSGLEQIFPQIPSFAQQLEAQWELAVEALPTQELQLNQLRVQLTLPQTGTQLNLRPTAPLKIPFQAPQSTLEQPLPPLRLTVNHLSSDLLKEFLPTDWQLAFQPLRGQLDVTLHSLNSFVIQAPEPIAIHALSLTSPSIPPLHPLDISITPSIHYNNTAIQASWQLQATPIASVPQRNTMGIQLQWQGQGAWQSNEFALQHDLHAIVTGLSTIASELSGLPSVSIQSKMDVQGKQDDSGLHLHIQSMDHRIGPKDQTWFTLRSASPWSLQTRDNELLPHVENLQLELQILDLPLQLAQAFVPGLQASAASSRGKFVLQSRGKGWMLHNEEPLNFQQLSIRWNQEPWLQRINTSAVLHASLDAQQQLQLQIPTLTISEARGDILALQSQITAQLAESAEIPWEFSATVNSNLAMARNQPLLQNFLHNVMSGQSRIHIKGRYQKQLHVEGTVEAQNVRNTASPSAQHLQSSLQVQYDPQQKSGQLSLPATLTANGQTTALTVNSRFRIPEEQRNGSVLLDIQAAEVQVADVLDLVSTFTPQTQPIATVQTRPSLTRTTPVTVTRKPPSAPDQQAVWEGWDGKITLAARKVVLPNGDPMEDLKGQLDISPQRVAIESLTGKLNGAPSSLQAAIEFVPNTDTPYRTNGKLSISNLNTAGFFKNTPQPMLSTRLSANGNIQGASPTLAELADTLQGKLLVEGKEGIFRAFAGKPALNNVASLIGGIGGLIFGDAAKLPPELRALERLSSILSEIPFREIRFEAVRGDNLDVQIKEIRITGNDIQLLGQGIITHQTGVSLMQQPLQMAFNMDLRGVTADIFQQAGLIKALPESASPQQFRKLDFPMQLSGSLGQVDASQIWQKLVDEVANMLVGSKPKNNNEKAPTNAPRNPLDDLLREILR